LPKVRLPKFLQELRSCQQCADVLPLGPRPVVQWAGKPRVVVVGQAPGTKVHESGVPWDDDSGDHLRQWLGIEREQFYDGAQLGLMPMGFCYPGKASGGDAPPDPRCAPTWHSRLLEYAGDEALILLVGTFAQAYYLGKAKRRSLTETVRAYEDFLPRYFPLPHPSWRSKIWMKNNPWFGQMVLPRLRAEVLSRLHASPTR